MRSSPASAVQEPSGYLGQRDQCCLRARRRGRTSTTSARTCLRCRTCWRCTRVSARRERIMMSAPLDPSFDVRRSDARDQPPGRRHQPLPAATRGEPGGLVGVGGGGLRRGTPARRTRPSECGIRGLPLVPRDGARVLRGRGDGGADERRVRQREGRPRGAPGRRQRLHGGHPGPDRAGRLADDGVHDAGRRTVLLRHLLPASPAPEHARLPAGARRGH
jgi:hypothetical protein